MLFYSQNFLTTNASLFIPSDSIIQGVGVSTFKRKGVQIDLPALHYSYIPTENSAGVITRLHNSYSNGSSLQTSLRGIRIYLVPDKAYRGDCVVPYATRSSNRSRITQMPKISLSGENYTPYIEEELSNLEAVEVNTSNSAAPAPPATGRVVNHDNLYRTIV